ncbi:hypothetical protein [Sinosporangium siamense]|uniref:hypothetical protein n=1 Tax=Sinosporangium siamense TaxID=1367973 RepID=UPI00194EE190|nr:hypothetical protein [Sinosporangium siamense]
MTRLTAVDRSLASPWPVAVGVTVSCTLAALAAASVLSGVMLIAVVVCTVGIVAGYSTSGSV